MKEDFSDHPNRTVKNSWKEILVIACLVFSFYNIIFPILGIILTLVLGRKWEIKRKIILIVLFIVISLVQSYSSRSLLERRNSALGDFNRIQDMTKIFVAQQEYRLEYGVYYTSQKYPQSIEGLLMEAPVDMEREEPYGWIDNTDDNLRFCAYAFLDSGEFYLSSHRGAGRGNKKPLTLFDCERAVLSF
jgi:hypothetical protein